LITDLALDILYTQKEIEKIFKIIGETDKFYPINRIGLLDELSFQVLGYAKIGSIKRKDQSFRYVYAFNCSKHGLQITISSRQPDNLQCKHCLLEQKTEIEDAQRMSEDYKEKLRAKADKTKTDLSKFRTNNEDSK